MPRFYSTAAVPIRVHWTEAGGACGTIAVAPASLGTCGTLALRAGLEESMAEASRALNPREMLTALIEQGQAMFTYAELNRLFGADVQQPVGRAAFYRVRGVLLEERRVWLKNVPTEGYEAVRQGAVVERKARTAALKRSRRVAAKMQDLEQARRAQQAAPSFAPQGSEAAERLAKWRVRQGVDVPRILPAEPDSPETARKWLDERRSQPPASPLPPELPRLELGRDALERVTQAALAQVYREVARTLAEMAERYASLAEQALAGMK